MSIRKPELESSVEEHLEKACAAMDVFITKNTGRNGMPDRLLIKNGRHWFLELKRPGKRPTPLQEAVGRLLRAHGAVVLCADTKARVDAVMDALCSGGPPPGALEYGFPGRNWNPERKEEIEEHGT